MWGTQAEYAELHQHDTKHRCLWCWGRGIMAGGRRGPGDSLGGDFGRVSFGGVKTGAEYRNEFETPFFEYYLKGKPGFDLRGCGEFSDGGEQVGAV